VQKGTAKAHETLAIVNDKFLFAEIKAARSNGEFCPAQENFATRTEARG
jgi:hypothetical protein